MSKRRSFLFLIVFSFLFFMVAVTATGMSAYADDEVNVENITRIVIDVTAKNEQNIYIGLEEPTLRNYFADFGTTVMMKVRPDDEDIENADELYDDVEISYQWFYAPMGEEEFTPLDEIRRGNDVTLTVNECDSSGRYYVVVNRIWYNKQQSVEAWQPTESPKITLTIRPKELSIEFTGLEKVYNGFVQEVEYTIQGEVKGFPAGCIAKYNSAPANAGSYTVTVEVPEQNHNYSLPKNEEVFVITKAPLTITAEDVVVLAGFDYKINIRKPEGFCGYDDETWLYGLIGEPHIDDYDRKLSFTPGPGKYTVTPYYTPSELAQVINYDITIVPCTVHVNYSVLEGGAVQGFTGKATGSFSSDATIYIAETDKESANGKFFWQVTNVYDLAFNGEYNSDTYTVVMEGVSFSGLAQNICIFNEAGEAETVPSYRYNKNDKTLTLILTQKTGKIVVYHNLLWYIVPGGVMLIIIISLLLFHHRDRNKHKLNRLISGSAKVEADRYRKMIGEYEEKERRKV